MKKLILFLIMILPIFNNAQAHLGISEKEIRSNYPDNTFEIGYTDDGQKYISSFMKFGTFVYYFDKETKLSNFCIQVVDEMPYLNGQVETYNKKYVIVSDSEWKAYLEGGNILKINLSYDEEYKFYVFKYTF